MSEPKVDQKKDDKDSFEIPIKKNPIFLYMVINVGIVTFMVCLFYFVYQNLKQS